MSRARPAALAALLSTLGVIAFVVWRYLAEPGAAQPARTVAQATAAAPLPSTAPHQLRDPLIPDRPATIAANDGKAPAGWVAAAPAFQYSRSAAERGGIEPCATEKLDTSGFDDWAPLQRGRYSAPRALELDEAGRFDLIIHLHGDEPIRRELIKSKQRFVLYTLTLDPSQGYAPLFSGSQLYQAIVAGVEQGVGKRLSRAAKVGRVALSAWSAGFVGVEAALAQPVSRDVAAVILVDGLHAPRADRAAFKAQLQPFVDYAARAAGGERFMFVSHSSINPPDFASTTECAHYLLASLGGEPTLCRRDDALGLELVEFFSRGQFHVRGYAGNDKADHCAQLGVLRDVYAALGRHWSAAR